MFSLLVLANRNRALRENWGGPVCPLQHHVYSTHSSRCATCSCQVEWMTLSLKSRAPQRPCMYFPLNVLFPERAFFFFYPCGSRNLGCCYRCRWWTWGYPESINNTISLCSFIIYLTSALSYCPSLSAQVSLCSFWRFLGSWPLL